MRRRTVCWRRWRYAERDGRTVHPCHQGRVVVCGAGLMGHGIAQVLAAAGHRVALYEPELARAEAGRAPHRRQPRAGRRPRVVSAAAESAAQLARVEATASLAEAAGGAVLAIEAVFEDEAVKRALLAELDALLPARAIIGTNTSSISITRLAAAVSAPSSPAGGRARTSSARCR